MEIGVRERMKFTKVLIIWTMQHGLKEQVSSKVEKRGKTYSDKMN